MSASARRPSVLFLSTRFPFPLDTGGKIRTGNILRQLHRHFDVTVLSNVQPERDEAHFARMRGICTRFVPVRWSEPPKYTLRYYWKIFRHSLSRQPVTVLNDYSAAMEAAIRDELARGDYDLLICDFVQSAIHLEEVRDVPILLFQHNVEATIPRRHYENASSPLMRWFWRRQYEKMAAFEGAVCRRCQAIIAVSEVDAQRMESDYGVTDVRAIPTGVDTEYFAPQPDIAEKKRLVFVGSMDWEPNDDAMTFFIDAVLPRVRERLPDHELLVVGRNPSPRLESLARRTPGVELTGWVEDTRPSISSSEVFIVPIRIGGGTRIKIYEAMAMGKAVVSTSVGAEGLPLEHEQHILFADDAASFADAVVRLVEDPAGRARLAEDGRRFVLENFGWEKVGDIFADICRDTLPAAARPVSAP